MVGSFQYSLGILYEICQKRWSNFIAFDELRNKHGNNAINFGSQFWGVELISRLDHIFYGIDIVCNLLRHIFGIISNHRYGKIYTIIFFHFICFHPGLGFSCRFRMTGLCIFERQSISMVGICWTRWFSLSTMPQVFVIEIDCSVIRVSCLYRLRWCKN